MVRDWLRREEPPWRSELFAFILRSRFPGLLALIAAIVLTVDVSGALPWLVAFLVAVVVVNLYTYRRVTAGRTPREGMGLIEMVGPMLLAIWLPGLLYPALLISVMSVILARLIYGPRVTVLGIVVVVAIASLANHLHPMPYAPVSIAVYFVVSIRVVAGLGVLARREIGIADELRERANHDDLTGLKSRAVLIETLEDRLGAGDVPGGVPTRLLYLDVDGFKDVNDCHGHHTGDRFLVEIARRLELAVPEALVAARMGGDEFAMLIDGTAAGDSAAMSPVSRIHEAFCTPITIGDLDQAATVSVGEAVSPSQGLTVVELIDSADRDMYEAKAQRRVGMGYGRPDRAAHVRRRRRDTTSEPGSDVVGLGTTGLSPTG